ncbi:MAG TPA: sigma-70 family RNA polymerase sigma factor [Actinotalea sp.]|nr:sigma-70 family RNA polymerase sigma factor [Actinotalea sp.]
MTSPDGAAAEQIPDALAELAPGLLRFARTLTRDPQQAEDLTQETLVRALERAGSFRGESGLATWLHRIAYHLAVDRSRRDREVPSEDVAELVEARWREDAYSVDAAVVVARAQTRAELEDALIRLPVIYRAAVVLHDAEGLTVAQIAELAEIGLPAAKQRLRRGRMMLVTALARGAERDAARRGVPMRCWDARSQVGDYLDGLLDTAGVRRVEAHLETCPTCPPLYASLVGATGALAATALRDPDSVVHAQVAERIERRAQDGDA